MPTPSRTLLPLFALVGVAFSLGTGHVCARLAFTHGVTLLTAASLRTGSAALVVFALLRLRGIPILPLKDGARTALLFGLLIAVQTLAVQMAVKLMPVAFAILVFYTYPLFTGLAESVLGAGRLPPRLFATLCVAFAGLALVLGVAWHGISVAGVLAALLASISFTSVLVLAPRLTPGLAAPLRTFLMMGSAASAFIAASAVTHGLAWPTEPLGTAGLIGLAGFYAIGITTLFLVLPLLGATQTAVVLNLEPVAVAMVAWAGLGESLTFTQMLGALVVVAAVIYFQLESRRV
jgi:drug/metabolite transporter (DMT)-like permease